MKLQFTVWACLRDVHTTKLQAVAPPEIVIWVSGRLLVEGLGLPEAEVDYVKRSRS